MTKISVYRHFSELGALANSWERLKKNEPRYFPSFSEANAILQGTPHEYRVVAVNDGAGVTAIACFLIEKSKKSYSIGERRLFALPVRAAVLVGSSVLGGADRDTIAAIIRLVFSELDFDLMRFGEVIIGSLLHQAIMHIGGGKVATRVGRKDSIRWLIRLPGSYEEYLSSLSSATRNSSVRKTRKFERQFQSELRVVTRPDQVDDFLRDGETISRLTYQWKIGQRLNNDDATRQRYLRLANEGRLRCYMIYIEGRPVAFLRGELTDGLYHYETPGYDPEFEKASPGTVLLMWAIRDLIENSKCEMFDFGVGGDDRSYKAHYGNVSINCTSLELGEWYRPYTALLMVLQEGLSLLKNIASAILGDNILRQRIRKVLR